MGANHTTPSRAIPARAAVLADVSRVVAEQLGMAADQIQESATLESLGCDSLDIVEISMNLEEQFDISIPDEFGEQVRTVGEVTDGVLRLLAASDPQ
jgi:acyl carrier protein